MICAPEDDLRKGLGALVQVLEVVGEFKHLARSALTTADAIVARGSDPGIIGRIVAASLGAALHAVGQEVQVAATTSCAVVTTARPTHAAESDVLRCRTHGDLPWSGTIACWRCGHVYQMLDRTAPRFASNECPCGLRLMPGAPGETFSAEPICSACFEAIPASVGRAVMKRRKEP
jgi:hypothetical protein